MSEHSAIKERPPSPSAEDNPSHTLPQSVGSMPKLESDFLSHNFEGSSWVLKNFTKNPALSILASPLLLVDAALLPVRAITSREKTESDDEQELERLRRKQGWPGTRQYAEYTGKQQGHFNDASPLSTSRTPAGIPNLASEPTTSKYRPRHSRNTNKRTEEKAKDRHRSSTYPGWALPHSHVVDRHRARYRAEEEDGHSDGRPEPRRKHRHECKHGYEHREDGDRHRSDRRPTRTSHDRESDTFASRNRSEATSGAATVSSVHSWLRNSDVGPAQAAPVPAAQPMANAAITAQAPQPQVQPQNGWPGSYGYALPPQLPPEQIQQPRPVVHQTASQPRHVQFQEPSEPQRHAHNNVPSVHRQDFAHPQAQQEPMPPPNQPISSQGTSRSSGVSRRDFAAGQSERQTYNTAPNNSYAAGVNKSTTTASSGKDSAFSGSNSRYAQEPSGTRSSRQSTSSAAHPARVNAGSATASTVYYDAPESYVSQSTRRSFGSHASSAQVGKQSQSGDRIENWLNSSGGSRNPPKAPSTILTQRQYKSTDRPDSVAPWDSQTEVAAAGQSFQAQYTAQMPERGPGSGATGTQSGDGRDPGRSHASSSRSSATVRQAMPPARAPSISTINTADLPSTVGPRSRATTSDRSGTSSYQTANILRTNGAPKATKALTMIPAYVDEWHSRCWDNNGFAPDPTAMPTAAPGNAGPLPYNPAGMNRPPMSDGAGIANAPAEDESSSDASSDSSSSYECSSCGFSETEDQQYDPFTAGALPQSGVEPQVAEGAIPHYQQPSQANDPHPAEQQQYAQAAQYAQPQYFGQQQSYPVQGPQDGAQQPPQFEQQQPLYAQPQSPGQQFAYHQQPQYEQQQQPYAQPQQPDQQFQNYQQPQCEKQQQPYAQPQQPDQQFQTYQQPSYAQGTQEGLYQQPPARPEPTWFEA
ncbi:hypothetical protein LTR37_013106 [Vermiconidia calcicola]|uniref:Uncharacterized protein n=1 Tax=Vermiconidia calcicola TaxID=1690605 RepID=A0ACC3MXH5_9PEZI|nr:hypothetical protein LTR37_013106 [Vermiconidia calcicola]